MEIIASTTCGYFIALLTQKILFPFFGVHIPMQDHMRIAGIFTLVSIIRGYVFRRLFNWFDELYQRMIDEGNS